MWTWTSSVLLATLLVSGLSSPIPDDSAYKIPDVGTGRRAQYYVLHRDGTFKYGFDTGEGAYESAMQTTVGSQTGSFGYRSPEGELIHLEYEAGVNGFVARGDHLPVPSANLAHAMATVLQRTESYVDPYASSSGDASYNFQFESDTYSRRESSNNDGTVTGSYSYVDENGVTRSFTYRAGAGIGFEIEGDGLTIPASEVKPAVIRTSYKPSTTGSSSTSFGTTAGTRATYRTGSSGSQRTFADANIRSTIGDDGSYSFSYNNDDHSRSESGDSNNRVTGDFSFVAADDGQRRELKYEAGSDTGFIVEADHLPTGPIVPGAPDGKPSGDFARYQDKNFVDPLANTASDSSYQFGFDSDTYSRSETADKDGNVVGTYTVVEEDGTRVKNEFRAGKGIGYEVQEVSRTAGPRPSYRRSQQQTSSSSSTAQSNSGSSVATGSQSSFAHGGGYQSFRSGSDEESNLQTNFGDDGSYSFSYNTDDQHRTESGSNGRVTGDFSFVAADDGQRRELKYEAGSDTGFIVEADHLPVGPAVPGAADGKPSGEFARHQDKNFVDPLANTASDSSYQFGFDSDTYSRSETADKDGNVVGTYTVVEEDGTRVKNEFRAGKGIGYEVKEISRTAGPRPSYRRSQQQVSSSSSASQSHGGSSVTRGAQSSFAHGAGYQSFRSGSDEDSNLQTTFGDDGSYSFSYSTDDQHRTESGANGKVTGEFSFVAADDGQRRKLRYEAGSDTGFIVEGDHLPTGPVVPGASDGRPTGAFVRHRTRSGQASYQGSSGSSVRGTSSHTKPVAPAQKPTPYTSRRVYTSSSSGSSGGSSTSVGHSATRSAAAHPASTLQQSSDFTLHTYRASPDADKFGYVIRYH